MKDLGVLKKILGVEVAHSYNGFIFSQRKYKWILSKSIHTLEQNHNLSDNISPLYSALGEMTISMSHLSSFRSS